MIMKHLHRCQAEADFKSVRFLTGSVRQGEAFVPGLGGSGGLAYYDGAPGDRPAYDWDAVKRPNETDSPFKRSADPRDDRHDQDAPSLDSSVPAAGPAVQPKSQNRSGCVR